MDTTRRRELKQLSLVFLVAMLLRMLLGCAFNAPSIFTDEFQYVEMARSLPQGNGLCWDSIPTLFPCWLYALLIAPFINLFSWDNAYAAIRGMNAVLVALTVFPAYGLTRELAGHRRALGAAVLVGLLAGGGYSPTIMTENLFLPVFTLAIWAIYRAVMVPTARRRLLAGLACGLGFHVKPHAMLLPLIVAATVLIFEADRLRDEAIPGRSRLAQYLAGVGRHWLTAVGWMLAISPRIYLMLGPEHYPLHPFILKNFLKGILGSYTGLAEGRQNYSTGAMALSLGRYLLAWSWSAGLLPAWFLVSKILASLEKKESPATRLLTLLAVVSTGGMLMLVARHTLVTNPSWIMHERYYFIVLPATLCLFCARVEPVRGLADGRWLVFDLVPLILVFSVWVFENLKWTLATTSPSFTGVMLFERPEMVSHWLIALYVILIVAALGLYFINPGGFGRQFTIVALLFVAFNIGWYAFHGLVLSKWREDDVLLAKKIDRTLKDDADKLLVLKDGLTRSQTWHFGIRNPGLGCFLNPKQATWWEVPLEVAPDGQVRSPYPAQHSWLVAANTWKFNRKPTKAYGSSLLYHLDGETPLRLDPAQLAAYRDDKISSAALNSPLEYSKGLKLKLLSKKLPPAMTIGQLAQVQVRMRNESNFTLPGGELRLGLGYHWSDPKRLGSFRAIVYDDSRYTLLPEWIEPGEEFEVTMTIMPPDKPGNEYFLTVEPVVLVDRGRTWVKTWTKAMVSFTVFVKVEDQARGAEKVASAMPKTNWTPTPAK